MNRVESRRNKVIQVLCNEAEFIYITKVCDADGVMASRQGRALLLAWADERFGKPGSVAGGTCGVPSGCTQTGASYYSTRLRVYVCQDCYDRLRPVHGISEFIAETDRQRSVELAATRQQILLTQAYQEAKSAVQAEMKELRQKAALADRILASITSALKTAVQADLPPEIAALVGQARVEEPV